MSARNTIVFRFFKTYFTDKTQLDKLLASIETGPIVIAHLFS